MEWLIPYKLDHETPSERPQEACASVPRGGATRGQGQFVAEAQRWREVLNRRLRQTEYSIADIACYPWAPSTRGTGIELADLPSLA